MALSKAISEVCRAANAPLTPQEIRDRIKATFPQYYRTPSHLRNIEKGHFQDADHALLAQIYITIRSAKGFVVDESCKPMKVSLAADSRDAVARAARVHTAARGLRRRAGKSYDKSVADLLGNCEEYHRAYYTDDPFGGPCLYFHRRAVSTWQTDWSEGRIRDIYSTLVSWGMHRMGRGGGKMVDFDVFTASILALRENVDKAKCYVPNEMDDAKWDNLQNIFRGLKVMSTSVSLVGNSKVMHHLLPNIVPPIDREYTLWYLRGDTSIQSDLGWEWQLMRQLVEGCFLPILSSAEFREKASFWLDQQDQYPWDTSKMKIADNLIIGAKIHARSALSRT